MTFARPPPGREAPDGSPASMERPRKLLEGGLPELGGSRALDVRHEGELLGAISVDEHTGEPLSHEADQLLQHLASQAGLVLRNARLTEELRARLVELQTSRQRIVAAQDERAKQLERNIHDGAQQQLVALAVKLRVAEGLAEREPARTKAMLAELQAEATSALEDLRDLARGIYPPLLADKGLPTALEAQARKAPLPVSVSRTASAATRRRSSRRSTSAASRRCRTWRSTRMPRTPTFGSRRASTSSRSRSSTTATGSTRARSRTGVACRAWPTGSRRSAERWRSAREPGSGTTVTGRVPVGTAEEGMVSRSR